MKDHVVIGLIAALLVAMAVGLYLFYLPRRRRPTAMEIEHSEFRKKQNEHLWGENERLKCKLKEKENELALRASELTISQKERDKYRALWEQGVERAKEARKEFVEQSELNVELRKERDGWKDNAQRWNKEREDWVHAHTKATRERETAEKERDQARALANDLREYLDRALKIVNEQNEQIQQLTHVEARNPDGTFRVKTKGDRLREMIREAYRDKVMVIDDAGVMTAFIAPPADIDVQRTSKVNRQYSIDLLPAESKDVPAPTPVKHLREVNEEIAKAAEVQPTEGERPDDSHVGEQAQPADMQPVRDWNVPQAFPMGYAIPKGIEVICLSDYSFKEYVGKKGTVKYTRSDINGGGTIVFNGETDDFRFYSNELAPVDPRQHPEHPEFVQTAEQKGVEV